jgi:hypothetical protein
MFSLQSRLGGRRMDDDLDREFDEVYQTIVSGKGVRTDEEELALVNALIRRAEQGSFPQDGSIHIISPRADVDWASDEAMLATRPAPARNYGLAAGGLLIGFAVLIALISVMGGSGDGGNRNTASATSAAASTATALAVSSISGTLSVSATQTAIAQATVVWEGSGIVVGAEYKQKLPPVYPETLEIDGVPFRVYPSAIDGGRWDYEPAEGAASWIAGTVINWSFGLPALDHNRALIERLEQVRDGEEAALLRMSGGAVRHFRLLQPMQIARQQIEVFMQNKPGITIALLGDEQGQKRWLIRGIEDYTLTGHGAPIVTPVVEATPASPVPARP